jgi:hypothetical protein
MNYKTELLTNIDTDDLLLCYQQSKQDIVSSNIIVLPEDSLISREMVIINLYKQAAKTGIVGRVFDEDTNRSLHYFGGKREDSTLEIDLALYNTDSNGSKAWIYEFFKSNQIQTALASVGILRWKATIVTANIRDSIKTGKRVEGIDKTCPKGPGRIVAVTAYSDYGWD